MNTETKKEALNVEEVAAALGVSRSTAYRAVHSGEIPSIKVCGRLLVPRAAFDRLLACEA